MYYYLFLTQMRLIGVDYDECPGEITWWWRAELENKSLLIGQFC